MITNGTPGSPAFPNLLIAIGASAGGLKEILAIIEQAPPDFSASIVVATHRKPTDNNVLADILRARTRLTVVDAVDGDDLDCAHLYVARGQDKITVDGDHLDIGIDFRQYRKLERINDLFRSVAKSAKHNAVGVILSGLLSDGVDGLEEIQRGGGHCYVQHPDDAQFASMPTKALDRIRPDFVGTAAEIGKQLICLATNRECE